MTIIPGRLALVKQLKNFLIENSLRNPVCRKPLGEVEARTQSGNPCYSKVRASYPTPAETDLSPRFMKSLNHPGGTLIPHPAPSNSIVRTGPSPPHFDALSAKASVPPCR